MGDGLRSFTVSRMYVVKVDPFSELNIAACFLATTLVYNELWCAAEYKVWKPILWPMVVMPMELFV